MEWQPIKTAPKDGAFVVLYGADAADTARALSMGYGATRLFAERCEIVFAVEGETFFAGSAHNIYEHGQDLPTHWTPLYRPEAGE